MVLPLLQKLATAIKIIYHTMTFTEDILIMTDSIGMLSVDPEHDQVVCNLGQLFEALYLGEVSIQCN